MLVKGAKIYTPDHTFEEKDIVVEGGLISEVCPAGQIPYDGEVLDASGLLAIPGLVDIHFHGAAGADFCDASVEAIEKIACFEASKGILAICPATMTFGEDKLNDVIDAALEFNAKRVAHGSEATGDRQDTKAGQGAVAAGPAELVGINLEGPFISKNRPGAQKADNVIPPDPGMIERLLDRAQGLIKLIDIAPETEGAFECIKKYSNRVSFSIAHTESDYDTAVKAFENGADHVTHLFNAMNGLHHRNPGPIPAAAEAGAFAEVISDGVHVHPAMIRAAFKLFGPEHIVLISDSMRACGLSDGTYDLGGSSVTVCGNKAVLSDSEGTIAGSVTCLYDCMKKAMEFGISPEDAVRAATENPARSIGIDDRYGKLAAGYSGHFLLVDRDFEIKRIL